MFTFPIRTFSHVYARGVNSGIRIKPLRIVWAFYCDLKGGGGRSTYMYIYAVLHTIEFENVWIFILIFLFAFFTLYRQYFYDSFYFYAFVKFDQIPKIYFWIFVPYFLLNINSQNSFRKLFLMIIVSPQFAIFKIFWNSLLALFLFFTE